MANLERSAVTFNAEWAEGRNKMIFVRDITCVLTGQGDDTDKILAETLGFLEVLEVSSVREDDDSAVYPASPSYDGSFILLGATPATVTATVRMLVKGTTL